MSLAVADPVVGDGSGDAHVLGRPEFPVALVDQGAAGSVAIDYHLKSIVLQARAGEIPLRLGLHE